MGKESHQRRLGPTKYNIKTSHKHHRVKTHLRTAAATAAAAAGAAAPLALLVPVLVLLPVFVLLLPVPARGGLLQLPPFPAALLLALLAAAPVMEG